MLVTLVGFDRTHKSSHRKDPRQNLGKCRPPIVALDDHVLQLLAMFSLTDYIINDLMGDVGMRICELLDSINQRRYEQLNMLMERLLNRDVVDFGRLRFDIIGAARRLGIWSQIGRI